MRRGKIAKNNMELYTWKDLNVGIDIELNGTVYHLTDCDEFTKVWILDTLIKYKDMLYMGEIRNSWLPKASN